MRIHRFAVETNHANKTHNSWFMCQRRHISAPILAYYVGAGLMSALGCGLNGSTQHPGETAPPGFQARGFCRSVLRAGAATVIDERADDSKSRFAQETPVYTGDRAVRWARIPAEVVY